MRAAFLKVFVLVCLLASLSGILAGTMRAQNPPAQNPPAQEPQAPAQPEQAAGSVSNEDCAVCHEDTVKAFDRNPHAVLEKSPKFNLKNSCESCHGPGEDHALNDGDKTKILTFTDASRKAYDQKCLACHQADHENLAFGSSMHSRAGLSCADCHQLHSAAPLTRLLESSPVKLCMSCHVERRADFAKPYHHRVTEGAMRCIDCHQPHGGFERRQLRAGVAGEIICVKCHNDKAGPFVFEHAALRIRDCLACHEPHGSNNARMLVRANVRSLCLECHTGTPNMFSRQPPASHDIRSPRYQNCTTCHAQIHGSNSSRLFLR